MGEEIKRIAKIVFDTKIKFDFYGYIRFNQIEMVETEEKEKIRIFDNRALPDIIVESNIIRKEQAKKQAKEKFFRKAQKEARVEINTTNNTIQLYTNARKEEPTALLFIIRTNTPEHKSFVEKNKPFFKEENVLWRISIKNCSGFFQICLAEEALQPTVN